MSTSLVPVTLFLLGFSIAGLRDETEAARNTASTFLEPAHIIKPNIYKSTFTNVTGRHLYIALNAQQMNKGPSNLFPSPNTQTHTDTHTHTFHSVNS